MSRVFSGEDQFRAGYHSADDGLKHIFTFQDHCYDVVLMITAVLQWGPITAIMGFDIIFS